MRAARMRGVGQLCARQHGANHRRFALAVNLHEARPHDPQRALDVGQVHRRAAINDGLERTRAVIRAIAHELRMIDQPLDDGGGSKGRQRPDLAPQRKQLGGIDTA